MAKNYDDMYKEKLSEIFTSILRIDREFTNNKNKARKDFEQGLITEDTLKQVESADYNTELVGEASSYALSSDDRNVVLKYASFDNEGNIYLVNLENNYKNLLGKLDYIADTVKIYYKYYLLDVESLRESVLDLMLSSYNKNVAAIEMKMKDIEKLLGNKALEDSEYIELEEKLSKLNDNKVLYLDSISKADYTALMNYVVEFYALNENYFKWYKNRANKEDFNVRASAVIEDNSINGLSLSSSTLGDAYTSFDSVEKKLLHTYKDMSNFSFTATLMDCYIGKNIIIYRKYSKEECFTLFRKFYHVDGFLSYIASYAGEGTMSDEEIFNVFYDSNFKDKKSVDPEEFKSVLVRKVLLYFKEKIDMLTSSLDDKREALQNSLDGNRFEVDKATEFYCSAIDLISAEGDETDYLNGFISEELAEMLYQSLREYFKYLKDSDCVKKGVKKVFK